MSGFERNIYLSNTAVEEAMSLFFNALQWDESSSREEMVSVEEALGRRTAEPVVAVLSSPFFNASAMDGIAVKSSTLTHVNDLNPQQLTEGEDFKLVDTGDPIIEPYDAVIMIEDVVKKTEGILSIRMAPAPWQHVRPVGEDVAAGELILPSNHTIRAVDIGALVSGGITEIKVYKRPTVGIIPTGTEIIETPEEMSVGKILDSNSRMFSGLVTESGGIPIRFKPIPDDYEWIKMAVKTAVGETDLLIIGAGSSAGSEDYTAAIVRELGEVMVHGAAIKPGKPVILGKIDGKPVIGIPGYPVSAYVVFDTFVGPLIHRYMNREVPEREVIEATLSRRLYTSLKHKEAVRMKLGKVGDRYVATPLSRGAGVTMSLVKADGILYLDRDIEGLEAGEKVPVELLKPKGDIERTLVAIGSHDLALDVINEMMSKCMNQGLSSAHTGSLGGIMALKREECHLAPVHLLDSVTGTYNLPFIRKYFKNRPMCLITGIKREQGLMVAKGNPLGIKKLEDLEAEGRLYVNRQKGSGTRVLLDYMLMEKGIGTKNIQGYEREMTTHMMVATAVKSGTAHCGLGVRSAANAMALDFIPVGYESYDFIADRETVESGRLDGFIGVLKSEDFKNQLEKLGGYDLQGCGEVLYVE